MSFNLRNSLPAEFTRPDRTSVLSSPTTIFLLAALGILMRLPGIFVTGMYDLDEMLLQWGAGVSEHGVGGDIGHLRSVYIRHFRSAYQLAELMPRFWSAPYKVVEILFEVCIVLVLCRIVPTRHRIAFF